MKEVVKNYGSEDIEDLIKRLEAATRPIYALSDEMTNTKPWAAHWLGGDIDRGATEVRPARFQAALDRVRQASNLLSSASHELAMYTIEENWDEDSMPRL